MSVGSNRSAMAGVLVATCVLAGGASGAETEEFCYGPGDGACVPPSEWPGTCNVRSETPRQSPIDIFDAQRSRLPELVFRYRSSPLKVLSNGHTVEVEYEPGHGTLRFGSQVCELRQFHFHTAAEHALGGAVAPLEAHLVHACPSGGLAVVGVLMNYDRNKSNRAVGMALDNAARDGDGYIVGEVQVEGEEVDARDLLPRDTGYVTYGGSLTTPPCSEIVRWIVLRQPVTVSREQVETLQAILADTSPDGFPFNNRPLQDLEGRTIRSRLPPR